MENKNYMGCAFQKHDRYWLDGMISEYIHVWDMEEHTEKIIECGYYGSDCRNMYEADQLKGIPQKPDITPEVARDMIRTYKKEAVHAFCSEVKRVKKKVVAGCLVEVIRGRKVQKGTKLEVFWTGEKYNQYSGKNEMLAGCREIGADKNSKPIWIKAEYLKVLNPPKSPNKIEREKFLKWCIRKNIPAIVLETARTA